MNNFRDKIASIANNNQSNMSDQLLVGVVTNADEYANTCSVDLITQYGDKLTKHFVPVISGMKTGIIDWFPDVGDKVYVRVHHNKKYEIVSLYLDDYLEKHKHSIEIGANILTNFYNYTIGGNIF